MPRVGVRIKKAIPYDRLFLLDQEELQLAPGTPVIYESEEGLGCATTVMVPSLVAIQRKDLPTLRFVREASANDVKQWQEQEKEERKAYLICKQKIEELDLPMKLVEAVYTFDYSRVTFYFTAKGRVDFRGLLKNLAMSFRRTRIMLRQIGVCEAVAILGAMGDCGRETCALPFIKSYGPITIKMAKEQGLAANPNKLNGPCGRLKRSIAFEHDTYVAIKAQMPPIGTVFQLREGKARVIAQRIICEEVQVEYLETQELAYVPLRDLPWKPPEPSQRRPAPVALAEEEAEVVGEE